MGRVHNRDNQLALRPSAELPASVRLPRYVAPPLPLFASPAQRRQLVPAQAITVHEGQGVRPGPPEDLIRSLPDRNLGPVRDPHWVEHARQLTIDWSDPELRAVSSAPEALSRVAAVPVAGKAGSSTSVTMRIATAQVVLCLGLMVASPLLMFAVGRSSALAFALHGIGATLVLVLATMAMHKAYPLLRGGTRSWPAFRSLLSRLAIVSVLQLASGLWMLWYYHAEDGPGHLFADSAPIVDQLAMQFKIFAGLAGLMLFIAAWRSARHVTGERGDAGIRAPVFAVIAGWMLMICALLLGTAITWAASI